MNKLERAKEAVKRLKAEYPDAMCSLDYTDPFELLVSVRLAAQCTDARVNLVTPELFGALPDAAAFAKAPVEQVEQLIKTCGLYKTKARDLIAIGKMITEQYGGKVPEEMDELLKLPGVGRKTANLVRGDIFGKPAIVTDTHFIRFCNRMGFVATRDPYKVEMEMQKWLPPEESNNFCHRTVLHGRAVCTARKANCEACCLKEICPKKI